METNDVLPPEQLERCSMRGTLDGIELWLIPRELQARDYLLLSPTRKLVRFRDRKFHLTSQWWRLDGEIDDTDASLIYITGQVITVPAPVSGDTPTTQPVQERTE